jgi:hypothetical protein
MSNSSSSWDQRHPQAPSEWDKLQQKGTPNQTSSEWDKLQQKGTLNDPNFGSKDPTSDPYTHTSREDRQQTRLDRQLSRELKHGGLSERTRQAVLEQGLNEFANRIASERASRVGAGNSLAFADAKGLSTSISTLEPPKPSDPPKYPTQPPTLMAGEWVTVQVCINGVNSTKDVWMKS